MSFRLRNEGENLYDTQSELCAADDVRRRSFLTIVRNDMFFMLCYEVLWLSFRCLCFRFFGCFSFEGY
jgi:hypothetical protein